MSRRTIAILLIAFGICSIVGIGLWLWWPYRKAAQPTPAQAPVATQPPAYSNDQGIAAEPLVNIPVPVPAYDQGQINLSERQLQEQLRHQAFAFTARAGTYANSDEFAGMKQVYVDASPELQAYLETQRQQLIKDHPVRGAVWGQTVTPLSARFITPLPIRGKSSVDLLVQAQVLAGPDDNIQKGYKQVTLTYTLVNTTWVASRIVWADLAL
jgi:hypothetical protein